MFIFICYMLRGLSPILNLGPMSPNSGLFPYSPTEAVPVHVPNTVDCGPAGVLTPGPKFFLSFQLLLAQPLIDYHARSAWFLLHQQTQHHSRHLCTTRTALADYPVSSRPHAELHLLFEFGQGDSARPVGLGQSDPEAILFGLGQGHSAIPVGLGHLF